MARLTRSATKAAAQRPAVHTAATDDGRRPSPGAEPVTPPRKRRKVAAAAAATTVRAPTTPTPALVGQMARGSGRDDGTEVPRPADPSATNAPLETPGRTQVVAYPLEATAADPSPTRPTTGMPRRPTTTTARLLEEACAHLLRVEPRLGPVMARHRCRIFSPEGLAEVVDPFQSLTSGIIAQQVSGAAASAVKKRFVGLFGPAPAEFPSPARVAAADVAFLKKAGLSGRKAEYIKGLAEKFISGELSAKMLVEASYDEVLEKLTAVRGLGKWSVEMFACFGLKKMDVFSTGDLGVQRGMAAFMGKDVKKLKAKGGGKFKYMSEGQMLEIAAKFAPYRSLFMWYMWRVEDVNVDAVQEV